MTTHSTAVFFDFENQVLSCDMDAFVRYYKREFLDKVIACASEIAFMKAYADWSMPKFRAWAQFIIDNGIEPVQVFGYSFNQDSKNIADFMMTLDIFETAMTKPHIENFVIVTGDAGFSVIINRLRALGKRIILYMPNENCSRYLEQLADVSLCTDFAVAGQLPFTPPVSEDALVLEEPFSPSQLPMEDKTNIRIMQPAELRKFEDYGIAPTRENVRETIHALLRVLTVMRVYDGAGPFTVISVSRLSALIDAFVINFTFRNYGHKTITKYLNEVLKDTHYSLARRNKESLYYVIVSEEGLREAFPALEVRYELPKTRTDHFERDNEQERAGGRSGRYGRGRGKSDMGAARTAAIEHGAAADGEHGEVGEVGELLSEQTIAQTPLPTEVNIVVPPSNRTIIIAKPFAPEILPQTDKQNNKLMQPKHLKTLEPYGLVKYGELTQPELVKFLIGTLKILTSQNLYTQHPQIVASITLLTLLLEHFVAGFAAKKYGVSMFSKLVETLIAGSEFSMVRKDSGSQYYIVISEQGLREVHPDITVIGAKPQPPAPPARPPEPILASETNTALETAPEAAAQTAVSQERPTKRGRGRKAAQKPPQLSLALDITQDGAAADSANTANTAPATTGTASKKTRINDFYVRQALLERIKKGRLGDNAFNDLLNADYCAELFKTPLPLLKEITMPLKGGEELDENGKKAYWKRVFRHSGRFFLIYGDWKAEEQKTALAAWVEG